MRSILRNATEHLRSALAGSAVWGAICSQHARVSSVRRCRTSAPRLVSSVLHTPSWATRSDASILSSEGQGRGFVGSGPVAGATLLIHHSRDGIRLDLSAPRSTRRDGNVQDEKGRISRAFELGETSYVGFQLGYILGPRSVRCIEVWGQTGTRALWYSG